MINRLYLYSLCAGAGGLFCFTEVPDPDPETGQNQRGNPQAITKLFDDGNVLLPAQLQNPLFDSFTDTQGAPPHF